MRSLLAFVMLATLMTFPAAFAEDEALKTANKISCTELDEEAFDSGEIGKIDIQLDGHGRVAELKVMRIKTATQEAMDLKFDTKKSKFKHETIPGKIIGKDEETKETIYDWNIDKIEMVEAESTDGSKVRLHINDHKYASTPGSTVYYTVKGKSFSSIESGYQTLCKGKLLFPMYRQ